MNTLITGSSGLIGSALVPTLIDRGHTVHRLHRRQSPAEQPFWDPEHDLIELGPDPKFDVVIHLAGESIAQGRWNAQKKARIKESRVQGTRLLAKTLGCEWGQYGINVNAIAPTVFRTALTQWMFDDQAFYKNFL